MSEWTGEHTWNCGNPARGGLPDPTKCLVPCECPCHRAAYAEQARENDARVEFGLKVDAERRRQIEKGYTPEHDDEHGADHLLLWAIEYVYRSEQVKAVALLQAARDVMVRKQEPHGLALDSGDGNAASES